MQVRCWGVRGSIASPMTTPQLRAKLRRLLNEIKPTDLASPESIESALDLSAESWTYGGNTSCVEVSIGNKIFILDAGTGLRALGMQLAADGRAKTHDIHLLFSHFHWDHICGFPYFGPIYQPGREISVWSGRSDSERLLRTQMADAHFPVKWDTLPSRITCRQLPEKIVTDIDGVKVSVLPLIHPDKAYGYRIEYGGRAVCYLTDTEVSKNPTQVGDLYSSFVEGADVVIVDAMYGFLDFHEHVNFGHSTIFSFIDMFKDSQIGELVIFHHDPLAADDAVTKLRKDAQRYAELMAQGSAWKISAAFEGQSWDLPEKA